MRLRGHAAKYVPAQPHTHQHPHPPGSHLFEKGDFGGIRVAILNEGDFIGGNAFLNELGLQVVIG